MCVCVWKREQSKDSIRSQVLCTRGHGFASATGRARTVGTQVLDAITWRRHRVKAVPVGRWRVTGNAQARCGRSGGGRAASGNAAGAAASVSRGQVDGWMGASYRHGQAVRADGRRGAGRADSVTVSFSDEDGCVCVISYLYTATYGPKGHGSGFLDDHILSQTEMIDLWR